MYRKSPIWATCIPVSYTHLILLASTENGEFQTGIPGLELQNYIFSDLLSLDSLEAMEASVRQQEAELGAA